METQKNPFEEGLLNNSCSSHIWPVCGKGHVSPAYLYVATLNGSSHAASMLNLFCVWTSRNPFSKKNDLKRPTVSVNLLGDIICVISFPSELCVKKNLPVSTGLTFLLVIYHFGAPDRTRTYYLMFRKHTLYPDELRVHSYYYIRLHPYCQVLFWLLVIVVNRYMF